MFAFRVGNLGSGRMTELLFVTVSDQWNLYGNSSRCACLNSAVQVACAVSKILSIQLRFVLRVCFTPVEHYLLAFWDCKSLSPLIGFLPWCLQLPYSGLDELDVFRFVELLCWFELQ